MATKKLIIAKVDEPTPREIENVCKIATKEINIVIPLS
jgi:hypothetical protein